MDQSQRSVLDPISDGNHSLRDRIDRHRLISFVIVVVGLSQLLLAFATPLASDWLSSLVVMVGGVLLIIIGRHMCHHKEPFEGEWGSEWLAWLESIQSVIFAVGVAAAAVSVSFGLVWLRMPVMFMFMLVGGITIVFIVRDMFS
jgi:putative Mn2+ efflux pump MntP